MTRQVRCRRRSIATFLLVGGSGVVRRARDHRRHGGTEAERSRSNHEGHEDHEGRPAVRLAAGGGQPRREGTQIQTTHQPAVACICVPSRRGIGARCAPANRTAGPSFCSVPPFLRVDPVSSVSSVPSTWEQSSKYVGQISLTHRNVGPPPIALGAMRVYLRCRKARPVAR